MKKTFITFMLLFFVFSIDAQHLPFDKSKFDVKDVIRLNKLKSDYGTSYARVQLTDQYTEATIMRGGYFTLGTSAGISPQIVDDNCQLTFGHPFALTSFPFLWLDGKATKIDTYFANQKQMLQYAGSDSIIYSVADSALRVSFVISKQTDTKTVAFSMTVENLDVKNHTVGLGLLLDLALGKNGEGSVLINGNWLQKDTALLTNIPTNVEIWEKTLGSKGIGINLNYIGDKPQQLAVGNWQHLYQSLQSFEGNIKPIYDLALKMKWTETNIEPGNKKEFSIIVELLQPQVTNDVLLRWDMPSSLSIENNLLFPEEALTYTEIVNNSSNSITASALILNGQGIFDGWESNKSVDIPANQSVYQPVTMSAMEVYEEMYVPTKLTLFQSGKVLDELPRNIYIPASPFTSTGLDVTIDSVVTALNQKTQIYFNAKIEETGQLIYDLQQPNIFVYENDTRIYDVEVDKDSLSATNQADIVFILDVTGSMSNEIADVKNNIVEFADLLKKNGVDYRLGMVTFLDFVENKYNFTNNVATFKSYVEVQDAHGGDDEPENSLQALMDGCTLNFRPSANRIFIWITDATYHIDDRYTPLTVQVVLNKLMKDGITVHCVGPTYNQTQFYDQIVMNTGGNFYDINQNFRDVLVDVSKLKTSGKFILSFWSNEITDKTELKVEVHYAGLGGNDSIIFNTTKKSYTDINEPIIYSFPNPFYASTQIKVNNIANMHGTINLYNVAGQVVKQFTIPQGSSDACFSWDAKDAGNKPLCEGIYLLRLNLYDKNGKTGFSESVKIIYTNRN